MYFESFCNDRNFASEESGLPTVLLQVRQE